MLIASKKDFHLKNKIGYYTAQDEQDSNPKNSQGYLFELIGLRQIIKT